MTLYDNRMINEHVRQSHRFITPFEVYLRKVVMAGALPSREETTEISQNIPAMTLTGSAINGTGHQSKVSLEKGFPLKVV